MPLTVLRCPRAGLLAAATLLAACGRDDGGPRVDLGGAAPCQGAAVDLGPAEGCAVDGVWRLEVAIPVTWTRTMGIAAGEGTVRQIARVERRALDAHRVAESIRVCGVEVPPMRRSAPEEHFHLIFDPKTFDDASERLSPATTVTAFSPALQVGATFLSGWATSQLGVDLPDAERAPWPTTPAALVPNLKQVVDDRHGACGIPATPELGGAGNYVAPPLYLQRGKARAGKLFFAIRNVERIMGEVRSCDEMVGEVEVKIDEGASAAHFLNSSVVACEFQDGEPCSDRISFLAGVMPRLEAAGRGSMRLVRVAGDTSCASLRAAQ